MRTRLGRAEQVERNRSLLLAAARRVFLDRGYSGASLEAIAEAAGFSKGVVYSQFAGKADLFLALLDERIAQRAEQNRRATDGLAGPDAVGALLRAAQRDAHTQPGWALLLVEFRAQAARDPDLNARYARAHAGAIDGVADVLADAYRRAGLQPRLPARRLAEFVLAVGPAVTLERTADPAALPDHVLEQLVRGALGLSPHQ
jgi:AcrR family transcriptional regulator